MNPQYFRALGNSPLARLRRIRGDTSPPPDKLREAITRLAKTPDGQTLLNHMLLNSYGKTAAPGAPDSALREIETRKKFLDEILALIEDPSAPALPPPPATPPLPG